MARSGAKADRKEMGALYVSSKGPAERSPGSDVKSEESIWKELDAALVEFQ